MSEGSRRVDESELGEDSEERDIDRDAMGNDKRRQVVGKQYGATVRKRLLVYGLAVGVILIAVIVFFTVVKNVDEREVPLKNTAPWAQSGVQQTAPRDVDFLRNGPRDNTDTSGSSTSGDATIPRGDILNR